MRALTTSALVAVAHFAGWIGYPQQAVAEPKAPVADPKAPVADPKAPVADPKAPIAEPTAPVADPKAPIAEPTAPVAEPIPDISAETFAAREYDRPHTLAQLGLGLITIPEADVCLRSRPCTKGDTSLEVDFWQMYRANRYFAIGAGTSLALNPTVDNPPSGAGIDRNHTRSYFSVEAQARYYALRMDLIELWLGITAGGVIISDRYAVATNDDNSAYQPAIIGPRASTVRTEGVTVGGVAGAQWTIAPNWAVGASFRYSRWFVPETPATSVFLDPATLTGQQGVLYMGLLCSYRIIL